MTDITNDINQLQNLFNKKEFNKIEQLSKSLLIKHNGSFDINLIIGLSYLANKNLILFLIYLINTIRVLYFNLYLLLEQWDLEQLLYITMMVEKNINFYKNQ